jgi:hypothetical protein
MQEHEKVACQMREVCVSARIPLLFWVCWGVQAQLAHLVREKNWQGVEVEVVLVQVVLARLVEEVRRQAVAMES